MTDTELFKLLAPDSKANRYDQYPAAWAALNDPNSSAGARANARCWLTHRTADGEVPYDDWVNQIKDVSYHAGFRWEISNQAADFYTEILVGKGLTEVGITDVELTALYSNPGSTQSFLRIWAIMAYSQAIEGNIPASKKLITDAFNVWREVMSEFDPMKHPFRWAEMAGDSGPLMVLSHLAGQLNMFDTPMPKAFSPRQIIEKEKHESWVKCLIKIRENAGYLW